MWVWSRQLNPRCYLYTCSSIAMEIVDNPKAHSKIWKYFGFQADHQGSITDSKCAVCKICNAFIQHSGNTTNLNYHLKHSHPDVHKELLGETSKGKAQMKQLTVEGSIAKSVPYGKESVRYKQLVNATAGFICEGLQPVRVVDEPTFRNLLSLADPRFVLPHRTSFSEKVLPEKYLAVRTSIEHELAAVECKYTITCDIWTSQQQQKSYLSLTCHYINKDFKLKSCCLQTREVPCHRNILQLTSRMFWLACLWIGTWPTRLVQLLLTMPETWLMQ